MMRCATHHRAQSKITNTSTAEKFIIYHTIKLICVNMTFPVCDLILFLSDKKLLIDDIGLFFQLML